MTEEEEEKRLLDELNYVVHIINSVKPNLFVTLIKLATLAFVCGGLVYVLFALMSADLSYVAAFVLLGSPITVIRVVADMDWLVTYIRAYNALKRHKPTLVGVEMLYERRVEAELQQGAVDALKGYLETNSRG